MKQPGDCWTHHCPFRATRVVYDVGVKQGNVGPEIHVGDAEFCDLCYRRLERTGRMNLDWQYVRP